MIEIIGTQGLVDGVYDGVVEHDGRQDRLLRIDVARGNPTHGVARVAAAVEFIAPVSEATPTASLPVTIVTAAECQLTPPRQFRKP